MYIHRHLESILEKASKMFGAVLVMTYNKLRKFNSKR